MSSASDPKNIAPGLAALSICESILISLQDLKIVSAKEVSAILEDAAEAHRNADQSFQDPALHREVVDLIERIVAGGNSVGKS